MTPAKFKSGQGVHSRVSPWNGRPRPFPSHAAEVDTSPTIRRRSSMSLRWIGQDRPYTPIPCLRFLTGLYIQWHAVINGLQLSIFNSLNNLSWNFTEVRIDVIKIIPQIFGCFILINFNVRFNTLSVEAALRWIIGCGLYLSTDLAQLLCFRPYHLQEIYCVLYWWPLIMSALYCIRHFVAKFIFPMAYDFILYPLAVNHLSSNIFS